MFLHVGLSNLKNETIFFQEELMTYGIKVIGTQ